MEIMFNPNSIDQIPNVSGIYFFYKKNELLYIGKAKFLKNRIKEHYNKNMIIRQSAKNLINIIGKPIIDAQIIFMWTDTVINSQRIDLEMHLITKIIVDYLPSSNTKKTERDLILLLRPKLNYQILQIDPLESLFMYCHKLDNLLLNSIW